MAAEWELLRGLFEGALERPQDERAAFLDDHTKKDPLLRREIESLLAAHESAGPFLSAPAVGPPLEPPESPPEPHRSVSVPTRLAPGTSLGAFTILEPLGAGGMGEVYRARDTRLDRQVAIKVLSSERDTAPGSRERFEREARAISRLSHPRICTVHDIGVAGISGSDVAYLVMELLDGETLAARIARGPLSIEQSLAYALDIADALIAAHSQRIVHRDLKPANVMLTSTGVKLLDFGLAQLRMPEPDSLAAAPVSSVPGLTSAGLVMGTLPYTSPEQLRGEKVDARTDIFAFGTLLYEMLTGNRPFKADSQAGLIAAVLAHDVAPVSDRQPLTPANLDRIVQKCLAKNPDDRWQTARDLKSELVWVRDGREDLRPARTPSVAAAGRRHWRQLIAVALPTIAALTLAVALWRASTPPAGTVRLSLWAPGRISPQLSAAISPDGRRVAFVATGPSRKTMLWVRTLDSLEAVEVPGTDRAAHPFWSPDGQAIGFIADAKLKTIDLASRAVQTLADGPERAGASWSRDGVIIYTPRSGELAVVPATGGAVTTVLTADASRGQVEMFWPDFLPDGRHFLYHARNGEPEFTGVYVGSLDSKETKLILRTDVQAKYSNGYLLFLREETLMAQPFDLGRLELYGTPSVVADGVWFARDAAHASFSVSQTGSLAYVNSSMWNHQLQWVDRSGKSVGAVGGPDRYANVTPQLSPDGQRIAIGRGEYQKGDIWILDPSLGTQSRITFTPDGEGTPVWSANGQRLMFQTGTHIVVRNLDTGADEVLCDVAPGDRVADWSQDGASLVLLRSGTDLFGVALAGARRPFPFLHTAANETQAELAPNGKWIAYTSNESGHDEVYVQSFPVPGGKRQISTEGGAMPRWRRDGKELFYLAANQFMTAVPISTNGASLGLSASTPLFHTRLIVHGSEARGLPTAYDVTSDGQRFLLNGPPEDAGPPMTVVLNWASALRNSSEAGPARKP